MNFETQKEKELYDALKALVDKYICNRDSEHEFISCKTFEPREIPWYWEKAKYALSIMEE